MPTLSAAWITGLPIAKRPILLVIGMYSLPAACSSLAMIMLTIAIGFNHSGVGYEPVWFGISFVTESLSSG